MAKFKMGNLDKPNSVTAAKTPRAKLLRSLNHQKEAFHAIELENETEYRAMVGCVSKRIRPWWFKEPGGPYGVRVYYGNRVLDVDGNCDVIVGETKDLIPEAFDWLMEMVEKGHFDKALKRVSRELSDRQRNAARAH